MTPRFRSYLSRAFRRIAKEIEGGAAVRKTPLAPTDVVSSDDVLSTVLESRAVLKSPITVSVPLAFCRDGLGRAFTADHPFLSVLSSSATIYDGSVLETYYSRSCCNSAIKVLDVVEADVPGLYGMDAEMAVLPWFRLDPSVTRQKRDEALKRAGAQFNVDVSISDGHHLFGPVSIRKGRLEMKRLVGLRSSMLKDGYKRGTGWDGDVAGELLVSGNNEYSVRIRWGLHRTAVAAHLAYKSLPIRFELPAVKREEVAYWHQVRAGRFTPRGALKVFDRFMRGEAPTSCKHKHLEA